MSARYELHKRVFRHAEIDFDFGFAVRLLHFEHDGVSERISRALGYGEIATAHANIHRARRVRKEIQLVVFDHARRLHIERIRTQKRNRAPRRLFRIESVVALRIRHFSCLRGFRLIDINGVLHRRTVLETRPCDKIEHDAFDAVHKRIILRFLDDFHEGFQKLDACLYVHRAHAFYACDFGCARKCAQRRSMILFKCVYTFERQVFEVVVAYKSSVCGRIFHRFRKVDAACFNRHSVLLFVPLFVYVVGSEHSALFVLALHRFET